MRSSLEFLQGYMRRSVVSMRTVAPFLFIRELLRHPAKVGAVWPSSPQLARKMAESVPIDGTGLVVELGAGTGAVTQALLDRGVSAERLLVIERSALFVAHLRRRFPQARVMLADATTLASFLPKDMKVDTIVSSIPLRSLPEWEAGAVVRQWRAVLSPQGQVVQFTYALRGAFDYRLEGFLRCASRIAWANLPPARVIVFRPQR
jgi:phosphatidylethanolamine/phosphatidyl-N-methylethanolamine N-methyltransferase